MTDKANTPPKPPRTEKQLAFCHEFRKDRNATKAATRAGASPRSAYQTGFKWLKKPEIKAFIHWLDAEEAKRANVERTDIIALAREIIIADPTDYMDDEGVISITKDSPNRRAVKEIRVDEHYDQEGNKHRKVVLKLHDPMSAAERVAKLLGMDAPPPVERKELTFRIVKGKE